MGALRLIGECLCEQHGSCDHCGSWENARASNTAPRTNWLTLSNSLKLQIANHPSDAPRPRDLRSSESVAKGIATKGLRLRESNKTSASYREIEECLIRRGS